jgi:hypothetical protein
MDYVCVFDGCEKNLKVDKTCFLDVLLGLPIL